MKRIMSVIVAASVGSILAACSSTPKQIEELEAARAVVPQVEASPRAGVAAENIATARKSLDTANRLAEKGGKVADIQWESYVATRNAEIANQKILTAQAQEEIQRGTEERQKVLVSAREREADASAREAEAAKSRAMSLEEEAKRMQKELSDLKAKRDERGLILTLGDVLFDVNKATLKPGAYSTVDRLAQFLKEAADRKVVVEGHTDSTGSDEYNLSLSERRAEAVRTALLERGIQAAQITSVGKGETTPVATNDDAGGRQQNRRVEIVVQDNPRVAADAN
jgi:OmpA-OmpF porin, OOP family